ncbi:MAG: class I tRNA ligase family protein, partial [Patescibacteria group bacterium]
RGLIYKDEQYTHSVAHCWRCATRLFFNPQNAWYVNVQNLKERMKKTNEKVNWYPKHFKYGRFLKSMENAPDWNISRNRYWGSPVPVWECECGEKFVPGSIAELEEASGITIKDLHKPEIDEVEVACKKCNKKAKRTPEVLDSWIEAGSASFAELHFPFEKNLKLEDFFPPDFIAEYTGQIRAWFYVLHVIGTALYNSEAFKNVLVEGVILGTDGRKMSKNFKNYPDPKEMLNKYGGDALRLYLLGSSVMKGEDILISEEAYRNQVRGSLLVLWNIYKFHVTYVNENQNLKFKSQKLKTDNVLDLWILSRLQHLVKQVTEYLDNYNTVDAIGSINNFIQDFSTWYIRRSRERISATNTDSNDKENCFNTTHLVLLELCKLLAPIAPFITEEIFSNLSGEESIHLTDWPIVQSDFLNIELEKEMEVAREVVEKGHAKRKELNIKVRLPLASLETTTPVSLSKTEKIVEQELNIKKLKWKLGDSIVEVKFDTVITKELKAEGEAREIMRVIQAERKRQGTKISERIDVQLSGWPKEFEDEIKRKTLVDNLIQSDEFKVVRKQS